MEHRKNSLGASETQDLNDPEDRPTPIAGSGTYPVWRRAAQELILKVKAAKPPGASIMIEELRYYEDLFASWSTKNNPDDAIRSRIIQEYMEMYKSITKEVKRYL